MPAPRALYSKMLAERTASRNVLVLFYFFYFFHLLLYRIGRKLLLMHATLCMDTHPYTVYPKPQTYTM